MKRLTSVAGVLLLAVALGGCRGGDAETGDSGVKTDIGVTAEPCPEAVNQEKGCIYLGVISDLLAATAASTVVPPVDLRTAPADPRRADSTDAL